MSGLRGAFSWAGPLVVAVSSVSSGAGKPELVSASSQNVPCVSSIKRDGLAQASKIAMEGDCSTQQIGKARPRA